MAENEGKQVPTVWVAPEDTPILLSNMIICQFFQDTFVVSLGQMFPPPLLGTPEDIQEQLEAVSFIPVKTLARLSMTPAHVADVIQVLQENLSKYEAGKESRRKAAETDAE
jgi:hypothetical protein